MHPSWQRKVLPILCKTFPNVQFIVTTHSPQVLGEVSNQFNLFMLSENEERQNIITPVNRMDGFDSNFILEEYMDTASSNPEFRTMVNRTFQLIDDGQFDKSTEFIKEIQEIVGMNNPVVIELEGYLKRRKLIYEKNH